MTICSFALLGPVAGFQQMREELELLLQLQWHTHVNQRDYQGGWDVLPLRCASEHLNGHAILQSFALYPSEGWSNLPQLEQSPALLRFINELPYQVKSVRLMRLHPAAEIKPHCDHGLSLEHGEARLHLPLQTNELLKFFVNDQLVPMQAGQLWYINADQVHRVENKGAEPRINLVLDCVVNAELKEQIYAGWHTELSRVN
ncbi:aspartyl/asparaginyl beta-hydroxylase domain-containing protein [Rheinheimera sediminis]|uniref:aspartyl/asparaginyl beta-hydroxylase domain-containing protein n=1 Tax=Rheinheimera sp. YQF-1 TaxID=2499626 RepID=UPI000FDB269A|nr:aspartyl/asparaginyl beta-hydroxylase domain-containing protein [Rheinheimera sp. YQF-1]RVT48134.1 aspartyl/asparaginyl beta-hydroxylase domain-containing protein [Rheinheimera sp. YQF-1]